MDREPWQVGSPWGCKELIIEMTCMHTHSAKINDLTASGFIFFGEDQVISAWNKQGSKTKYSQHFMMEAVGADWREILCEKGISISDLFIGTSLELQNSAGSGLRVQTPRDPLCLTCLGPSKNPVSNFPLLLLWDPTEERFPGSGNGHVVCFATVMMVKFHFILASFPFTTEQGLTTSPSLMGGFRCSGQQKQLRRNQFPLKVWHCSV